MVLQPQVRSPSPVPRAGQGPHDAQRPDPVRIVGISGALLLNSAALLLMLVPLSRPATMPASPGGIEADWFEPRPVPPLPPPAIVPVVQPVTPATPSLPLQRTATAGPTTVAPPLVDGGSLPAAESLPAVEDGGAGIGPSGPASGPLTGMRLAYASAGAPPYPRSELLAGHQGTVTLRVLVDVDGRPLQVDVESGSGYRRLDEAARRHVLRNWMFQPAMRDGQAVQAIGLVPIEFSLERG